MENLTIASYCKVVGSIELEDGSVSNPSLKFINNTDLGMYQAFDRLMLASTGATVTSFDTDKTVFTNPIILSDSDTLLPDITQGVLYKKTGNNNLFWKTLAGETNITTPSSLYPLTAPSSVVTAPSYTFASDTTAGLSYNTGIMRLSINNAAAMSIDINKNVAIDTAPNASYKFYVNGNSALGGNLLLTGNLIVNGTTSTVEQKTISVLDPTIRLATANPADTVNTGVFVEYLATTTKYSGIFRKAIDGQWYIWKDYTDTPTTNWVTPILGSLNVDAINANTLTGTIQTALQPNVTTATSLVTIGSSATSTTSYGNFDIASHDLTTKGLKLNGTLVTSAASEINYLAGLTLGYGSASKALTLDALRNLININSLTATTLTGTLSTVSQPNITSLGDLTALTMAGAINLATNNITGGGTITATTLTGTLSTVSQPNITSLGDLTALTMAGSINLATNNITGGGTITATTLTGTLSTVSQPNITSLGDLTALTMAGAINLATNNITGGGTITATTLTGTLSTVSQRNITSLGALVALIMNGSIYLETNNITGGGTISATTLTGTLSTVSQPNITSLGDLTALTMAGAINLATNNITGGGTITATTLTGTLSTAAQANVTTMAGLTSINGQAIIGADLAKLVSITNGTAAADKALVVNASRNIANINILTATSLVGTVSTAAQPSITSLGNLTGLTMVNGAHINLNNAAVKFNQSGIGAPTTTTSSYGTKIILYPAVSGTSVDYAIGITSGMLWNSVPINERFSWYHNTTETMFLSSTNLTLVALANINLNNAAVKFTTTGSSIPTITSSSAGTKILLYPAVSGTSVDYAIGIVNTGTLWNSVPTSGRFSWYHNTTETMFLSSTVLNITGALSLSGSVTAGTWAATAIGVVYGGTGQTTYTNGQLLIGNTTGNTLTKATLTGTANQVTVTNSTGSITLSTPQSIATTSNVTFNTATLTYAYSPYYRLTAAVGGQWDINSGDNYLKFTKQNSDGTWPNTNIYFAHNNIIVTPQLSVSSHITLASTNATQNIQFNYYESGSLTLTTSGAYIISWTVYFTRVGKCVTLTFPADSVSRTVLAARILITAAQIPSRLCPNATLFGFIYGADANTNRQLSYAITNSGSIEIANSNTDISVNFTAGTGVNTGPYSWSASYAIA